MGKAKYTTYEEVFNDVQLIWDNCKSYNMAGSEIYKLAEYMEKQARRTIQKFKSQNGIQTPSQLPPSKFFVGNDKILIPLSRKSQGSKKEEREYRRSG